MSIDTSKNLDNVISSEDIPKTDEELSEVLTALAENSEELLDEVRDSVDLERIEAAVDEVFPEEKSVEGPDSSELAILRLQIIANSDLVDGYEFEQPEDMRWSYVSNYDFGPENVKVVWHGYVVDNDRTPDND